MKASRDATIFIDLSYLSPEEEALIQKVLLRDEDLKKLEMGRVRRLRESVPDPRQLKELTGEWFEDLKSKRHGRQPHVSAVVRSSMRWKKSTGQRSNPFLKALPEEKAGEKNETLPELFTDPRLIHPALTVQQDNKDEAIVLEVIEAGHQSEVKHQDQKLEKELKAKELNTQILDPWRSAVKEDWAVETRPKQTNGKKGKDFEMRSFSDSDEISNWESDESDQPQSNVVLISSKQRTEFGYADNPSDPKPEVLMNSVFGFEEIMQSPIPQRRSREEIRVRNVVNRQTTPVWTDELVIDSNVKNNQVVFEDRKTIPVISVNTPAYVNLDQKVLDPEQKGKERVVEEILVADIKQRSPVRTEEIVVDIDVEKNPDFLKRPVSNVNASKNIHLDPAQIGKERVTEEIIVSDIRQRSPARPKEINADMIVEKNPEFLEGPESSNLDPVQKGKERVVKEIVITDVKRGSPTRPKEVIVDFDVEQNPDSLKNPVSNVNTSEITGLNQSLDPDQKRKERIVEEIIVADFKQRSPTRTEEISVDRNVGKNPDFPGGPVYIINTSKSPNLDPLRKGKERVIEEIVVSDFKQRSPARTEEINVDRNVGKDLEFFEDPVYTINAPKDASSEPDRKGKERVDEEIVVADFKRKSPTRTEEINVDRNVGKDLEFLEEPVYTINAPKYVNPDQKGKEPVVEEIVVADFKRRSPTWTKEINVDVNVGKDLEVLEDPVYTINAPKSAYSDPGRRGKERVVEEIVVADVKRRSPTRSKEQIVDVESNPDIPELSIASGNTERLVKWDKNGKEKAIEEILVDDFKRRSPARTEELIVDVIVEANSGAGVHKNEDILTDAGSLSEPGLNKYRNGGGSEFESESIKKAVEEIGEAGPGVSARDTEEDEGAISDSEILAGVYARATRPKMGIAKKQTAFERDQVQESADVIPTIVIVPSEPEETIEMEGVMKKTPGPEVLVEVTKHVTDTWEDESVDSDGDSSSVSSQDSDISGKKGQLSASTLSVTERTASLLSVYSDAGDFGNVAVQGSVEFAIMYSPLGELVIMVEQCQDLAIANPRKQRTDPYVKTYLYPDKRSKRKTSIKKRTVSPVYVESLRYKVKREELRGKILNLSVWHNDSRGRNAFLGQVEIILKDWDWKHEALTWYNLQPKNADNQESQEYRGILFIALKYMQPEATGASKVTRPTGEIHIWLREARQLRRLKSQAVDSFVKCYMLPDTSKKSRQKTRVVKKTQDPVYNHTMVYDGFRAGEVGEACCELTVWDNNKLSNQFLGGVRLSLGTGQSYGKKVDWMDSEREEVEIWKKMIANPNSWVEAELPLRSSMTPRQ